MAKSMGGREERMMVLQSSKESGRRNRSDEAIISRLRFGHTGLNSTMDKHNTDVTTVGKKKQ